MNMTELEDYFALKPLLITSFNTDVYYDNIANPLKTKEQFVGTFIMVPGQTSLHYLKLKPHTFSDNTNFVQAVTKDNELNFLNYDVINSLNNFGDLDKSLMLFQFVIDGKKTMHFRKVYSFMNLLEDFGGLFGSIYMLCRGLHWFISKQEQSRQLL